MQRSISHTARSQSPGRGRHLPAIRSTGQCWRAASIGALALIVGAGCGPSIDSPPADLPDIDAEPTPGGATATPVPGGGGDSPTPTPASETPSSGDDDTWTPEETPTAGTSVAITLSSSTDPDDPQSRRFEVSCSPAAPIDLVCDETSDPEERHRLSSPSSSRHSLVLRGLKADTGYRCEAQATSGSGRSDAVGFDTDPLPADLAVPAITRASSDPVRTGYMLFNVATVVGTSTYTDNYLVILDPLGEIRWHYPGVGGGDLDVSWLGDDLILYGGFSGYSVPPTLVGLDHKTRFVATSEPATATEVEGSYSHDAGRSADGKSIFALTDQMIDDLWEGYVIRQIDLETNKVIWSWDSYVDGVGSGAIPPGADYDRDPYHANAIFDRWEDGRLYLYVSMKQLNQVIKIDHATKAVVWRLGIDGDFRLIEANGADAPLDRWFFYQHDAKIEGNTVYLYDNGTERIYYGGEDYSRALELELDTKAMTARIVGEFTDPGWAEPIWGGYDPLPGGGALAAIGHCWPCDVVQDAEPVLYFSALVELDASRHPVWRADFQDTHTGIYRAERIDGCDIFHNERFCD